MREQPFDGVVVHVRASRDRSLAFEPEVACADADNPAKRLFFQLIRDAVMIGPACASPSPHALAI